MSEDRNAPLSLSAIAENETLIGVLRENLAASDLFESADIKSLSRSTGGQKYSVSADLTAFFAKDTTPLPQLDVELEPEPEDAGS